MKVTHNDWVSLIVVVSNSDIMFHICSDFKDRIMFALVVVQYSLSKLDDLFTILAGGQKLIYLDIS